MKGSKLNYALLAAGLILSGVAISGAAPLNNSRPNMVLIIGDDICWRDFGFMGSNNAKTPNIDKLAGEGMAFDRLYTAASMCAPCRTHIYTGLYPVRSGGYPNHCLAKEGTKSIVHYLQEQGYRVGLTGKTHIGPNSVFPFEHIKGFEHNCNAAESTDNLAPSIEFMTRDREQPFCEVICSIHAHSPYTAGDPSQYDASTLELPENICDTPAMRGMLRKYYAEIGALDDQVGAIMETLKENNLAENTIIVFLSEQGYSMPGGKWSCFEDGLRAAGFVWWPGKVKPVRSDAIVEYVDILPTLIEIAGGKVNVADFDGKSFAGLLAGKTTTHKTEAYGLQTNVGVHGALPYPSRTVRDERYRLIVNYMSEDEYVVGITKGGMLTDWKNAALKNPDYEKLVQRIIQRPHVELYDHKTDPFEVNNLAANPEYKAIVEGLQTKLEAWQVQQGDSDPVETEMAAIDHLAGFAVEKTQKMLDGLK
ncbi:Choline-sulfatase [Pontiella desulfatans]|uniref:Choline-sulfatase n=1 Tax=Pontiella desulfatans TaxID=2750659 RepID=A0A6C2U113_PONDE|nr:sulfatase-like hydrolase/transferase [Pontiella desulfatans]SPS73862.1 sulfatase S1_8 [Kiritimatiellales bacterium]VGO13660.1 Choline-sulfatase [Pontiella desulfatans]